MFSPFICGSFHHPEEDEDLEPWTSPTSTPKRSRRSSLCRSKDSKNPYSDRGLDKFSALLADLDDKRQKIYTQKGSEEISFVRFAYSNSNDCKPIVVKSRDKKHEKPNLDIAKDKPSKGSSPVHETLAVSERELPQVEAKAEPDQKAQRSISFAWKMNLGNWRRPSYYLPVIVILILLFLAMFGRSFAILCTSLGWYLVPTFKGTSTTSSKKPKRKKEYVRRSSDVKVASDGIASPRSVLTGLNDKSPRFHGHQRSW
ncbi:hypothetical protein RJ639_038223 [Escallonia herrerae]|uniref:ZCF37 n=1 Tax=Escallonia herrerae TaxID=1293975 RepID=A0AA88WKZ4_9ASTE|nr:hypothetical protein RJ639_038223 [Escallonia herrerae]